MHVPSSARSQLSIWPRTAHVQQNFTVVQYKKKGRTPTNERTTNEIPFNIKDVRCPCLYSELLIRRSVVLIYSTVLTYRPIDSSTIRRLTTRVRLGPLLRVSWRGRK
jgi:hypothetical protein